jgi:hypothetical protein
MSEDGDLYLWECPHILELPNGNPDFVRCGYVARATPGAQPGHCPYAHREPIRLVPLVAHALCGDCEDPIPADDCRTPEGRLICGQCAINYISTSEER